MGKIEVCGTAERTVDYDLMKMELNFHMDADTPEEASEKVMRECEDFLAALKKGGADISGISLKEDSVMRFKDYTMDMEREEYHSADRKIEIVTPFDMKTVNIVRTIVNGIGANVSFGFSYLLSDQTQIMEELLTEALMNAKEQAEVMAEAIGHRVISLVSADKNAPHRDSFISDIPEIDCLCLAQLGCELAEGYDNSDELKATSVTLDERIYTVWEIDQT
ncbi:MAG: SIMPL domain-containing protein [Lachnospiraceae bacterium]|nr:SIMPL domain-containing protein [Lachnospiraceae bacterium]